MIGFSKIRFNTVLLLSILICLCIAPGTVFPSAKDEETYPVYKVSKNDQSRTLDCGIENHAEAKKQMTELDNVINEYKKIIADYKNPPKDNFSKKTFETFGKLINKIKGVPANNQSKLDSLLANQTMIKKRYNDIFALVTSSYLNLNHCEEKRYQGILDNHGYPYKNDYQQAKAIKDYNIEWDKEIILLYTLGKKRQESAKTIWKLDNEFNLLVNQQTISY